MSEAFKKLDLATPEGRKEHEALPAREKAAILKETRELADNMTDLLERKVVASYQEAYDLLSDRPSIEAGRQGIVDLTDEGDFFFDVGGGPTKLGNIFDGASKETPSGIEVDDALVEKNIKRMIKQLDMLLNQQGGRA